MFFIQAINYSTCVLNSKLLVLYWCQGLNNEPIDEQTTLNHLNTGLVYYIDPHCILIVPLLDSRLKCNQSLETEIFFCYFCLFKIQIPTVF